MKCTNCGQEIREGLKFCTACGNKIETTKNNNKKALFKYLKIFIPILIFIIILIIIITFLIDKSSNLNKNVLNGIWYEYSPQDVFVYEWIFYDDGTCTSEMRIKGGSNKSNAEYATYVVNNNKLIIYKDGSEFEWEYDLNEDCCWLYFGDEYGNYKFKITHYADKLTQEELDRTFSEVSEYIVSVNT